MIGGSTPQLTALAILLVMVLTALCRSFATWIAARWLLLAPSLSVQPPTTPFVILLPALREQNLVESTLSHFTRLDYPPELIRVVVVTTARERLERERLRDGLTEYGRQLLAAPATARAVDYLTGHLPETAVRRLLEARSQVGVVEFGQMVQSEFDASRTTYELVEEHLDRWSPIVHVIEAPQEWRLKAGQVQYALDRIDELLTDWSALEDCLYVAVYDFDGRPVRDSLRWSECAARTGAALLQQPGLTVPAGPQPTMFAVLDGQLHSRFALRLELWMRLLDQCLVRLPRVVRAWSASAVHTVGNGLFIDRLQLETLGGIPSPVDDLALGWRAADTGRTVVPIRRLTFYDAYRSSREAARSRSFICRGYLVALRDSLLLPDMVRPARYVHLARICGRLVQWAYGPLLRLLLLAFAASQVLLPTLLTLILLYVSFLTDIWNVRRTWRATFAGLNAERLTASSLLLSPIALAWYGQGPRRTLKAAIKGGAGETDGKTERLSRPMAARICL